MFFLSRFAFLVAVFVFCTGIGRPPSQVVSLLPRPTFLTSLNGDVSPFRIRSAFILPGEKLTVGADLDFHLHAPEGPVLRESGDLSHWIAPTEPGTYTLQLTPEKNLPEVTINAFVLVPAEQVKRGKLQGYAIGKYPRGEGVYEAPRGFIKILPADEEIWVSPHFQLKQFICKQAGAYPKFGLLREQLLVKLERILEKLGDRGIHVNGLTVVSGFRTPAHNRKMSRFKNSRHLYGDAADIFVDGDGNGRMDDLNGDGKSNWRDTAVLQEIVGEMETDEPHLFAAGGLGLYRNTRRHGPFVHVDARGTTARWGTVRLRKKRI